MTKPGIVYGNWLSLIAGFLLASSVKGSYDAGLFLSVLAGTSLVIACGCAINNVIDRKVDAKMKRTQSRAVTAGLIKPWQAIAFGLLLGAAGFIILLALVNGLTAAVGATGLFFYLVMYSYFKRRSWLGTLVGSVSGATPPVAGYTAVTGQLDKTAAILFLILVFWQMPHFYAIGIYRLKEYKAAGLPILPIAKGLKRTKLEIFIYTSLFTLAALALTILGPAHSTYAIIAGLLSIFWLRQAIAGFSTENNDGWARRMFGYSLIVLLLLSATISVSAILP